MWEKKTLKTEYQLYAVKDGKTGELTNLHELEIMVSGVSKIITDLFHEGKIINIINITTISEDGNSTQIEIKTNAV